MSDEPHPSAGVAIALQLAASHPEASLPCPLCAAIVKAANLDHHLGKVHPEHARATPSSGQLRVRGVDCRIFLVAIALLILWGVGVAVPFAFAGPTLSGVQTAILGGTFLFAFALAAAASAGVFKATLALDGDTLRLRWLLGLASREVRLPAALETGTFQRRRESAVTHAGVTEDIGTYLRLRGGGTITIGAERAAGLGKHWAQNGWSRGKKTRWVDIQVDRGSLVALEYELAARGQLAPRGS